MPDQSTFKTRLPDHPFSGLPVCHDLAGVDAAAVIIGPNRMLIGLDIEPLDVTRQRNILPLMASPSERTSLAKLWDLDAEEASVRTTELWVDKEAILKATGLGMGLAPQSFTADGLHEVPIPNRGVFHIVRSRVELDGRPFALSLSYQN